MKMIVEKIEYRINGRDSRWAPEDLTASIVATDNKDSVMLYHIWVAYATYCPSLQRYRVQESSDGRYPVILIIPRYMNFIKAYLFLTL